MIDGHTAGTAYTALGGITAVLVGSLGGVALLTRQKNKPNRGKDVERTINTLREENELLKQENFMLQGEAQRAVTMGKSAMVIKEQFEAIASAANYSSSDEGDEAWAALTEATVMRETLTQVCRNLHTAIHNIQAQLETGLTTPELDLRGAEHSRSNTVISLVEVERPQQSHDESDTQPWRRANYGG